jgi:ketosteroid isomerase-like protein
MSEENVEIVRSILADWARGDYSSVDWADPHIEFLAAADPFETRGRDALGRRWREFLKEWDHFATTPERFIDAGDDGVLVFVRFEGRGRASGIPTTGFAGGQLFTLRGGKVVRLVLYTDTEKALEAAGLSE